MSKVALYFAGRLDDCIYMSVKSVIDTLAKVIDNFVVIDPFKNNKLKNCISGEVRTIKWNPNDLNGWKEIYKYNRKFLEDNKIDTLIVYKEIVSFSSRFDNHSAIDSFKESRKIDDTHGFNFNQTKAILLRYSLVESASKICSNVYQYILDPQELYLNDVCNFRNFELLYYLKRDNVTCLPAFEYGVSEWSKSIDKTKEKDFIFYCGAVTEDRAFIAKQREKLESIKDWDIKINVSKVKPIKQDEYYRRLGKSRYTLIIQSYDNKTFSINRLVEAACLDCLGFVHKGACLNELQLTYPDIYDIVKEKLIVNNFKDVKNKIEAIQEEERCKILKEIKSTKSWKRFTNLNYLKKKWGSLEGIESR